RLVPVLRDLQHDPVAVVTARRRRGEPRPDDADVQLTDANAPVGLDLLFARDKWSVEPMLRSCEPDVMLCWGFPWKIPAEALAVPPLGSVNCHPAPLPRHRGPVPLAWALREGDSHFGVTWHRMDAELDTGALLAQTTVPIDDDDTTIAEIGPKIGAAGLSLLPRVFERIAARDLGDPQPIEGVSWAGHFGEDYATVDWSQPARRVHDQVRAWGLTFGLSPVAGPIAELEGARVRLIRTSLRERVDAVARVECGDGPLWILEHESV
ncbi:MAG: methionyl-tRNA formyltransferase, partial [Gaiellaceae bacterium]